MSTATIVSMQRGNALTGQTVLLIGGSAGIGLETARSARSEGANVILIVDDQLQTRVPGIWALGDCNGRGAFTHTSYNDYEIVARQSF